MKKILLILSSSFSFMNAQLNYAGEINPLVMTRTSDQSQINLPFRLLSLDVGYTMGAIDIKTVSSVEHRYDKSESVYDLREVYLAYYPDWGEVKIGKQIHAWGAADGNNPTDNLNPYDYYHFFQPGTGQKIGTMSMATKLYFGNYQIEGVFIPKYKTNRMPFGEKDFPLVIIEEPKIDYPVDDELEFGIRIQTTVGESDFGLSIFSGNDRTPSVLTITPTIDNSGQRRIIPQLGYRTTTVWGLDFVTFAGDFTVRGEGAIFKTKTPLLKLNLFKISDNLYEFHQEVVYSQYVLQVEYTTEADIIISAQFIGSNVMKENYDWYHSLSRELVDFPVGEFHAGMGTPFALFAEKAILINSSTVFMDDRLEIKGTAMVNLDETGYMISTSLGYSPWINWKFEMGLLHFIGDKNDVENAFTLMEDFSHLRVGMFYNF